MCSVLWNTTIIGNIFSINSCLREHGTIKVLLTLTTVLLLCGMVDQKNVFDCYFVVYLTFAAGRAKP